MKLKKIYISIPLEVLSSYFYRSFDLGFDKYREVAPLSRKINTFSTRSQHGSQGSPLLAPSPSPSLSSTLTLTSHLGQNVGLGKG